MGSDPRLLTFCVDGVAMEMPMPDPGSTERTLYCREENTKTLYALQWHKSCINVQKYSFPKFRYTQVSLSHSTGLEKTVPFTRRDGKKNSSGIMVQRHTLVVTWPHCLYAPSGCRWCLWVWWLCFSWRSPTWSWNSRSTGGCGDKRGLQFHSGWVERWEPRQDATQHINTEVSMPPLRRPLLPLDILSESRGWIKAELV